MPNWELSDKRIYQLLKHPYQVDKSIVEDMTAAYLEFATIKAFEESIPTENNKLKIVFLNKFITVH